MLFRSAEVFVSFHQNEASAGEIDLQKADAQSIRNYFAKLFPAYDRERVYTSDMKKMIKWYGILKKHDLIPEPEPENEEEKGE